MKENLNLANAAVIIACLYFMIREGFNFWILLILLFAMLTWGIYQIPKERKDLTQAQIKEIESRTRLNNSNAAFTTANALYLREHALWLKNRR